MKKSLSYSKILLFLFSIIIFFVTRQFPLSNYSIISNIALMGIFILYFPKNKTFLFYTFIVVSLCIYSFLEQNKISNIIRFAIILLTLGFAYYIKTSKDVVKILYYFVSLQCFVILGFELYMMFFCPSNSVASIIRSTFLGKEWGDIYSFNNFFYKIQLKGNAILPFTYMISYYFSVFSKKNMFLFRFALFLSCICAGNFAFIIIIALFHIYHFFVTVKNNAKKIIYRFYLLLFLALLTSGIIISYVQSVLEMKADVSNAIRFDQANVLINDLTQNPITYLFGTGLGHTISVATKLRDYNDVIYYELQSLYILNQLGVIFFGALLLFLLILTLKRIKYKDLLMVYIFYIIYAISNPYIFDTNHFIVIVILCCISDYRLSIKKQLTTQNDEKNNLCISAI